MLQCSSIVLDTPSLYLSIYLHKDKTTQVRRLTLLPSVER